MSVFFKLQCSDDHGGKGGSRHAEMISVESSECNDCSDPIVESITPGQFKSLDIYERTPSLSPLKFINLDNNFVEDYPDCIVGSFSIPAKKTRSGEPYDFAFFMDAHRLIFIDDSGFSDRLLVEIAASKMITIASPAHCLQLFLKMMLSDDMVFLSELEDEMEDIEESLLVKHAEIDTPVIMDYRRLAIHLSSFYQQITAMASLISDNENKLLTHEEMQIFRHVSNLASRLATRADTLKEYSLQLYEMQQTLIDMQQNSIMQVLTIVTVLLAPLTLVTGWFGMNLEVLPGLDMGYMWLALLITFFVCTGFLLIIFRRKKWL